MSAVPPSGPREFPTPLEERLDAAAPSDAPTAESRSSRFRSSESRSPGIRSPEVRLPEFRSSRFTPGVSGARGFGGSGRSRKRPRGSGISDERSGAGRSMWSAVGELSGRIGGLEARTLPVTAASIATVRSADATTTARRYPPPVRVAPEPRVSHPVPFTVSPAFAQDQCSRNYVSPLPYTSKFAGPPSTKPLHNSQRPMVEIPLSPLLLRVGRRTPCAPTHVILTSYVIFLQNILPVHRKNGLEVPCSAVAPASSDRLM